MGLIARLLLNERAKFDRICGELQTARSFPEDVEEIRDIPYLPDTEPAHRMDVYRPKRTDGPLPVVLDVHGGGLAMGSKAYNRWFNAQLCRRGFLVYSADYRLVPEHRVFDAYADISAAMDEAIRLAPDFGGKPGGIFLVGDNAGAYLIAYLTAMQRCPAMAAAAGVQAPKAEIRALGLISGMFYTTRRDKVGLTMPRYLYGPDWRKGAFAPYLDPGKWACLGDFPPTLLVTSRDDMLHQYTVDFAGALQRSGAACRLVDYPADKRLVHAFSAVDPDLPESQEVLSALADFFRQAQ